MSEYAYMYVRTCNCVRAFPTKNFHNLFSCRNYSYYCVAIWYRKAKQLRKDSCQNLLNFKFEQGCIRTLVPDIPSIPSIPDESSHIPNFDDVTLTPTTLPYVSTLLYTSTNKFNKVIISFQKRFLLYSPLCVNLPATYQVCIWTYIFI